jgi:hypothetical protein
MVGSSLMKSSGCLARQRVSASAKSANSGGPIRTPTLTNVKGFLTPSDFSPGVGEVSGNNNTTVADGYYELDILLSSGQMAVHHFYRLLGDVNGDGVVGNHDLSAIAAAIGQSTRPGLTPLNADVNGDGSVTAFDRTLATRAKGHKLGAGLPLG